MITASEAIEDFLEEVGITSSGETRETYAQSLYRFKEFLVNTGRSLAVDVSSLSAKDAVDFCIWIAGRHSTSGKRISKATVRVYLSGVSRFFHYILRENLVALSASDMVQMSEAFHNERHSNRRALPKLPPDEAVQALLAAAYRVEHQPKKPRLELARLRNIAMMEALRSAGMRVGELVKLKRDDLDYRAHTARVLGKGGKPRIVYFDDVAWQSIQAYLQARADGAKGRALYLLPVFARHDRRVGDRVLPLTTDSVRLVFGQLARAAEIELNMTPHSLRHAFATKMLDRTGDLALVQDMLGHSSPETTRIYAKVSDQKIREAHRAAFNYGDKENRS